MTEAPASTDRARFAGAAVRLVSPLLVWAAHLGVVYAGTSLVCTRDALDTRLLGVGLLSWIIAVATALALAALLWLTISLLRAFRRGGNTRAAAPFLDWVAVALAGLSAVAVIWQALPVLIVWPCG